MYKGIPYSNKIIKRRQEQRLQEIHKQNLRNVRPLTTNIDVPFEAVANPFVNNKKKDMLQEDRFTQIERQNRMLLQKIHTIMNKKSNFKPQKLKRNNSINSDRQKMNKSLNQVYRKKQLGDIQVQNAKLLKRIMDKKSDYDSKKLKEQWKKQKQVIKSIANYPFIIRDRIYKGRKKSLTSHSFNNGGLISNPNQQDNTLSSPIQLVRIRNLSGNNFLITVKYDGKSLQILGDNKSTKQIKVIEIPKEEGLQFIEYECEGKLQRIFECLRYDGKEKVLYLVGKEVDLEDGEGVKEGERQGKVQQDQQQLSGQKKGLKKREMSNIYEIENSQLQTEPHNNINKNSTNNKVIEDNTNKNSNNNNNDNNSNNNNNNDGMNSSEMVMLENVEVEQVEKSGDKMMNDNKQQQQIKEQDGLRVVMGENDNNKNGDVLLVEQKKNDQEIKQKDQVHSLVKDFYKNNHIPISQSINHLQPSQQQHHHHIQSQSPNPNPKPQNNHTSHHQQPIIPIYPNPKLQPQSSQQLIIGAKSEFQLTSLLENTIG